MKICIITEEYIPPVKRFSLSLKLAEALSKENEVHLVAPGFGASELKNNTIFHKITVPNHDEFNLKQRIIANLKLTSETIKLCRKNKIDLIYGWWPVAFFSSILTKTPYVADMPEFLERMYRAFKKPFPNLIGPILKTFQILAAKRSKAVITESKYAINEWISRGVSKNKLFSRPYGIESDRFRNGDGKRIRKKFGISDREIVLMFHGDISRDDGVDILLESIKSLNVKCIIIGDGPPEYVNFLKSKAGKNVIFTGWVNYSEISDYLSACDIYVAPFRSSGYTNTTFPLKQMEAMSASKPVVCSKIKAFSEAVSDKKDILLVQPGNIQDLKEKIVFLTKNKNLRQKLAKNASKTAEKFRWENAIKTDINIINKFKYAGAKLKL